MNKDLEDLKFKIQKLEEEIKNLKENFLELCRILKS